MRRACAAERALIKVSALSTRKYMTDLALGDQRVLIREDLNVPIKDGTITSDARIRAALPSLQAALAAGARTLVMSHLGRPTEGVFDEAYSLMPVAERLAQLLGVDVQLVSLDDVPEVRVGGIALVLAPNGNNVKHFSISVNRGRGCRS
jgi:phosphoglycerate kinase